MVLADAPGKAYHEAADRCVLKEQTELIDDQHSAAVPAFDAGPQSLGEEEMHRSNHLVTQLAHTENHDWRVQVDVGRGAEHLAEAAVDPTLQDDCDPRAARQTVCNVAQHRLQRFLIRQADSTLDHRTFRFVKRSANASAKVDSVGSSRSEPRLVATVGGSEIQDVQRVTRAKRELNIYAAQLLGDTSVFVLRIDDVHAGTGAQRAHHNGREQVRLASSRMAEYRDICVRVSALIEWVDQNRRSGRRIAADEEPAWLLKVRLVPWKKRDQGGGVDDPLALQPVRTTGMGGHEAVPHPKSAALQVAEDRPSRPFDPARAVFERFRRGRGQSEVHRDVEGLVLAGGEAPLQVLCVGQRSGKRWIRRPCGRVQEISGAHIDELALEVVHDPGRGQRGEVPRQVHCKA